MSRLKQYIIEGKEKDIILKLKRDCKPFLDQLHDRFLYRGTGKPVIDIRKYKPRKNRRPRDISILVHTIFDKLFKEKFGWKARSEGVFTTGDQVLASRYGKDTLFFPIGQFKYLWSPKVDDLYAKIPGNEFPFSIIKTALYTDEDITVDKYLKRLFNKNRTEFTTNLSYKKFKKLIIDKTTERIKPYINDFTNTNLSQGIKSGHEIAFLCSSYYVVSSKYLTVLEQEFND